MKLAETVRRRYMMRIYSISRRRWQMWCLRARRSKSLRLVGFDRSVVTVPIYSDICKFTRPCAWLPHTKRFKDAAILASAGTQTSSTRFKDSTIGLVVQQDNEPLETLSRSRHEPLQAGSHVPISQYGPSSESLTGFNDSGALP